MTQYLTETATESLNYAAEAALEMGQNYVGTEHLLVGLIREKDGVAGKILEANNITDEQKSLYMADSIHPTQAGYLEWWTPVFENKLKEVIKNESN